MKPILVARHIDIEGLGFIESVLAEHRIPVEEVRVDLGAPLPGDTAPFSGLILLGGPMSVNDPLPWISDELALIQQADARGLPILGHCLGAQLIAKALGGTVGPNPVKEIGWLDVTPLPVPESETVLGTAAPFEVFHWHGETFSLPEGAVPILESTHCKKQGFVRGNTWAFQCHMELTAQMLPSWIEAYRPEIETPTATVQSESEMTTDAADRAAAVHRIARPIYERWVRRLR